MIVEFFLRGGELADTQALSVFCKIVLVKINAEFFICHGSNLFLMLFLCLPAVL